MAQNPLTPWERAFRIWMLISAVSFGFAVPFFLLGGAWIVPVINAISRWTLPFLPLYPLPEAGLEGAFWRVLSVSMMAMLTWACCQIYQDIRGKNYLTPIVLLSKFCSTSVYFALFLSHHYLAYLVGALTDGPIFLATWFLWYMARPGERYLDVREEAVFVALGEAYIPRGGAFATGFEDVRDATLESARTMFATLNPFSLFLVRLMFRLLNWSPALTGLRPWRLLSMAPNERPLALMRLEGHRSSTVRLMAIGAKAFVLLPFFAQPEPAAAVGYDPDARVRP